MSLELRMKSESGHALCLPAGLPSEQDIRQREKFFSRPAPCSLLSIHKSWDGNSDLHHSKSIGTSCTGSCSLGQDGQSVCLRDYHREGRSGGQREIDHGHSDVSRFKGSKITLKAEGKDSAQAIKTLGKLIENKFGEE